jgi:hypothetical protein
VSLRQRKEIQELLRPRGLSCRGRCPKRKIVGQPRRLPQAVRSPYNIDMERVEMELKSCIAWLDVVAIAGGGEVVAKGGRNSEGD